MGKAEPERVALITGGNRGIGLEITRQLSTRGFHVVVGARDEDKGQRVVQELMRGGAHATFLLLDVSSSPSIENAARTFGTIADHLDVLVNNAGIYPDKESSILGVKRQQMIDTLQTNSLGPLEVTQSFRPHLQKAVDARVINLSSGYGETSGLSAGVASYCLSKLALNGLTIMLSEALRAEGIAVNSMCPGWVRTDMGGSNAPRSVTEGADTAVWLADEASHELTGRFFRNRAEINW